MAPRPRQVPAVALALLLGLAAAVRGQVEAAKPSADDTALFVDDHSRMALTAATMLGTGASVAGGLPGAVALLNPQHSTVWPVKEELAKVEWVRDRARPLPPDLLARVRDGRGIPHGWDDAQGQRAADLATDEHVAFNQVLYEAFRTTQEAFARSARRDLEYVHLFEEPRKYRGEVVHVRGRLKRLLRHDPPADVARIGVKDLYEGWIFGEVLGANPTCVLVTELPKAIKPGLQVEYQVSFDGYFFKKYRYKSADSLKANEARDAPLLIGHTLVSTAPPPGADVASAELAEAQWMLPALLIGSLGGAAALLFGLTWWFRRADRGVRTRLDKARVVAFKEPDGPPMV